MGKKLSNYKSMFNVDCHHYDEIGYSVVKFSSNKFVRRKCMSSMTRLNDVTNGVVIKYSDSDPMICHAIFVISHQVHGLFITEIWLISYGILRGLSLHYITYVCYIWIKRKICMIFIWCWWMIIIYKLYVVKKVATSSNDNLFFFTRRHHTFNVTTNNNNSMILIITSTFIFLRSKQRMSYVYFFLCFFLVWFRCHTHIVCFYFFFKYLFCLNYLSIHKLKDSLFFRKNCLSPLNYHR